jgi:hypothetical protein
VEPISDDEFGDDTEWMTADPSGDSAVSPREKTMLQNVRQHLANVKVHDCSTAVIVHHRAKWDLSAFTSRHGYVRLGAREEFHKDTGSVNVHAHCDWTCYRTSEPTQVLTASLVLLGRMTLSKD